jgi:hypothetical protein
MMGARWAVFAGVAEGGRAVGKAREEMQRYGWVPWLTVVSGFTKGRASVVIGSATVSTGLETERRKMGLSDLSCFD